MVYFRCQWKDNSQREEHTSGNWRSQSYGPYGAPGLPNSEMKKRDVLSSGTFLRSRRGMALIMASYILAYGLLVLCLASSVQTTVGLSAAKQTLGIGQASFDAEGKLDSDLAANRAYGYDFTKNCVNPKCTVLSTLVVPQVFRHDTVELQFSETGTSLNAPSGQESVQATVKFDTKSVMFLYDLYATGPGSYIKISGGGGTKGTGSSSSKTKTLIVPPGDVAFSGPPTSAEINGTSVQFSTAKINGTFYGDAKAVTQSKDSSVTGGIKPLKDGDKSDALPDFIPPANCDTTKQFELDGEKLTLKPGVYCTKQIELEKATVETDGTGRVTVFVTGGDESDGVVIKKGSIFRGVSLDQNGQKVTDARQLAVFVKGDMNAKDKGTKVDAACYVQGKMTISADEFVGGVIANKIEVVGTTATYYTDLAQESYPLGPADATLEAWNASISATTSGHSSQ